MTQLVGILNITPDSFSDGGNYVEPTVIYTRAQRLIDDGAIFIDVGAESTRPGATPLTADQEWQRLRSVLPMLLSMFPDQISVDTYHPENAARALEIGPIIINDVTGMGNPAMIAVVASYGARCIVSHLPAAEPQAAHQGELVGDIQVVIDDLLAKESLLRAEGLQPEDIILDPGIGFGKTPELNWQMVEFAKYVPGKQVMIGYSRKRFLGELRMELEPNLAAGRTAITTGATYLRVHDVAGHRPLVGYTVDNVQ